MVLHIPNFIVKGLVFSWMGYLTYQYAQIYRLDQKAKKLDAYIKNKTLNGEKIEIPEELKQAQLYKENHYGQKLLERMKTQHVLEEQVKYAIAEKNQLRQKLISESNEEEVSKLEDELLQLNQLFSKIQSKNIAKKN